MVNEKMIKEFISSDLYNGLLELLYEKRGVKINEIEPSDLIIGFDVSNMEKSGFSLEDISSSLKGNEGKFISYVISKLDLFIGGKDIQEGNDDDDEIVQTLPFYKNFLVMYAIEFSFFEKNPSKLGSYLKDIRIPKSKKYLSELEVIYKSL